ncbi:hypothetical protein DdX_05246 [Ditylenchus destructor]|uniref:Uncharacterized protein n=1 Tax=Ditylenchus destructor TaxID=166010 RepID=A0AAD4NE09_9BILA|nr:hypothetical protein DdX_05246 [Ditylenchus destructor]
MDLSICASNSDADFSESSERPVICERYFFTANLKVQFYAFILELCFNCKSSNFAKKPHKTECGYRIEYRLCSACASRNAHSDRSYVKDIQNDEKKDFYLDWKMNENLLWMLKAYHRTMPFYTYQTIMCGTLPLSPVISRDRCCIICRDGPQSTGEASKAFWLGN